jgi:hypothetical protein
VVVPEPEPLSIDVAVRSYIGTIGALRKGDPSSQATGYCVMA